MNVRSTRSLLSSLIPLRRSASLQVRQENKTRAVDLINVLQSAQQCRIVTVTLTRCGSLSASYDPCTLSPFVAFQSPAQASLSRALENENKAADKANKAPQGAPLCPFLFCSVSGKRFEPTLSKEHLAPCCTELNLS